MKGKIMEENQIQTGLEDSNLQIDEPISVDNSEIEENEDSDSSSNEIQDEGQSFDAEMPEDPSEELILGKFKSVEDLSRAYEELQKRQGQSSEELGNLRKEIAGVNEFKENLNFFNAKKEEYLETILRDKEKYNLPEYFQDPTFKEIYKEALYVYGADLDTERMIDLIEKYVSTRIQAHEKKKLASNETQSVLDSMTYSKNPKSKFTPPKKSFDEMTPQEVDELLDRLI
jgi:hypothetical protein